MRRRRTLRTRPYAASKASSDHLVRAWVHTYGLPAIDYELLEQLWAVSVSGEADSADDCECSAGQGAAGLRRWTAGSRLALRGRSLPGVADGAGARTRGRDLQRWRRQSAEQS